MIVRDNRPRPRDWGEETPGSRQRVSDMEAALRQGPRSPTTFEALRVELNQPDATDGEIHQAALDAGLIVEED